jgi:hypothetical protein
MNSGHIQPIEMRVTPILYRQLAVNLIFGSFENLCREKLMFSGKRQEDSLATLSKPELNIWIIWKDSASER